MGNGRTNVIARTYATGAVVGGATSYDGGLVGWNMAAVTDSYAMGAVSG